MVNAVTWSVDKLDNCVNDKELTVAAGIYINADAEIELIESAATNDKSAIVIPAIFEEKKLTNFYILKSIKNPNK